MSTFTTLLTSWGFILGCIAVGLLCLAAHQVLRWLGETRDQGDDYATEIDDAGLERLLSPEAEVRRRAKR